MILPLDAPGTAYVKRQRRNTVSIPDLLIHAERLGAVGTTTYYRIDAVISTDTGGGIAWVCSPGDWATSPVAARAADEQRITTRLAELHDEIARLEAERARLVLPAPEPKTLPALAPCPRCGRGDFRHAGARGKHVKTCGGATTSTPEPPRVISARHTTIIPVREETPSDWRCTACNRNVFAPDLIDPTICLKCAKDARQNGVHLEAQTQ
jgi:hypothetical protein